MNYLRTNYRRQTIDDELLKDGLLATNNERRPIGDGRRIIEGGLPAGGNFFPFAVVLYAHDTGHPCYRGLDMRRRACRFAFA
jgi:hypothetical protein